ATFSIVASDPTTGDLGVAVESKFPAVGALVPWAEGGVGAIATQALANTSYGSAGLSLLRQGKSPAEVVEALVSADPGRDHRQLGVVDAKGRAATYTGSACFPYAGGLSGAGYACQGNILAGEETIRAMAGAFEATRGDLQERLISALEAGQAAGGDR